MKSFLFQFAAGAGSLLSTFPALAQYNQTETRNAPTSTNVYAWQQIELQPGCVITPATTAATARFEAKIKPLEAVGGRWSEPTV